MKSLLLLTTVCVVLVLSGVSDTAAEGVQQSDLLNILNTALQNITQGFANDRQQVKHCPLPFTSIMNQCFYINTHVSLDFDSARKFCQQIGGDLAQPKNPFALTAYIWDTTGTRDTLGEPSKLFFTLGASDLKGQGDWRWISGEEVDGNLIEKGNWRWPVGLEETINQMGPDGTNTDWMYEKLFSEKRGCLSLNTNTTQGLPYYDAPYSHSFQSICEYIQ